MTIPVLEIWHLDAYGNERHEIIVDADAFAEREARAFWRGRLRGAGAPLVRRWA